MLKLYNIEIIYKIYKIFSLSVSRQVFGMTLTRQ